MTVVLRTVGSLTVVLLTIVRRGNLALRRARHVRRNRSTNRLRDRLRSAVKVHRLLHRSGAKVHLPRRSDVRTHRPSATRMPHVTRVTRTKDGKVRQRIFHWPVLKPALAIFFLNYVGTAAPGCPAERSSASSPAAGSAIV